MVAFPRRPQPYTTVLSAGADNPPGRPCPGPARGVSPSFDGGGKQRTLGILIALLFHAALLSVLFKNQPEPQKFIPPMSPVMVDLISETRAQVETPPAQKPAEPAKPKATTPKPKPKVIPKPKRVQPKTERPPVLSTPTDTSARAASAEREVPAPQPPTEAAPPRPAEASPAPPRAAVPAPVSPPRFNADYLRNPAPAYPALSRSRGEEGRVVLRVLVDAEGRAEQVDIRTSSGHDRLDDSARATVKQWKFVPARQGDQPVPAWVLVPISFSLEE